MKAEIIKRSNYSLLITGSVREEDDGYLVQLVIFDNDIDGSEAKFDFGFESWEKEDALRAFDDIINNPEECIDIKKALKILGMKE